LKTLGVEGGFGRAVRIEVVLAGNAKPPPEEVLTYALMNGCAHIEHLRLSARSGG